MRWLAVVCLLAACEPPPVTICENRGSHPSGEPRACLSCEVVQGFDACYTNGCEGVGCTCLSRAPETMGPAEFRTADCSACGLWCEPPQLPCGARCVGPDEACPDRPSAWACRTREVPAE